MFELINVLKKTLLLYKYEHTFLWEKSTVCREFIALRVLYQRFHHYKYLMYT